MSFELSQVQLFGLSWSSHCAFRRQVDQLDNAPGSDISGTNIRNIHSGLASCKGCEHDGEQGIEHVLHSDVSILYKQGPCIEDHCIDNKHIGLAEPKGHACLDTILTAHLQRTFDLVVIKGLNVGLVAKGSHCADISHCLSHHLSCFFEQPVCLFTETLGHLGLYHTLDDHERSTGKGNKSDPPTSHKGKDHAHHIGRQHLVHHSIQLSSN